MDLVRKKCFPFLAGALWLIFLMMDLARWGDGTWVKFAAICLCMAAAWTGCRTRDGLLVAVALCFTVAADWFLLVRDDHYELGVGLFIIVQLLYAYRLYLLRGKKPCKRGLVMRLVALVGAILLFPPVACLLLFAFFKIFPSEPVLFLLFFFDHAGSAPFFLLFSFLYFSNLIINTCEAFALKKRTFAWGLLLFVCCDLCVGAWNLNLWGGFARIGMWLFYLPSQVLIVLSQDTKGDPTP